MYLRVILYIIYMKGSVAQWLERSVDNGKVGGSIPPRTTSSILNFY